MRKLIVSLIVLVLLVALADRGAMYGAQTAIAKQLSVSYDVHPEPDVDIHGIPFLTQAIDGTYEQIDVRMKEVTRDDIRVENVEARLFGVKAPISQVLSSDAKKITASRAEGSAVVPFDMLKKRLPDGFSAKPQDGKLVMSGKANALGLTVPVKAVVKLGVGGDGVVAKPEKITVAGDRVPTSLIARQLAFTVPIHDLPMHLKIERVHVTDEGIKVSASAQHVMFVQS